MQQSTEHLGLNELPSLSPSVIWTKDSWKKKTPYQLPKYPNENKLKEVVEKIENLPPLVFSGEVYQLRRFLADVAEGKAFILQGGDCAESFAEFSAENVANNFRVLLQMSVILSFVGEKRVLKIGRMAGQFAKPRSSETETVEGATLPSYRGDIINGADFDADARTPDPHRILTAYHQSAATLNFLRSLSSGGFTDSNQAPNWLLDFVENSPAKEKYKDLANLIQKRFEFLEKYKIESANNERLDFFTSHEGLLLPYEQALTRLDNSTGEYIATSAHFLWIGDRTRHVDGAHAEFLRGVVNPVGIKCGPTLKPDNLLKLLEILNPSNSVGKIVLISRMGAGKVARHLPDLISAVKKHGKNVVWICDPMHGNTEKNQAGIKFRSVDTIFQEIKEFFDICEDHQVYAGGIHLEMTGKNVTECIGGPRQIDLTKKYETFCDPRLNDEQAIDLGFKVCELIKRNSRFFRNC